MSMVVISDPIYSRFKNINDKTTTGILDIKTKLGELKALIQDVTSKHKE